LRWDNEKGYRLRGDGVAARLGEIRGEVGIRKMEAPGLIGMPIQVEVRYGKECGFGLGESSRAQHGDQCVAMRRWGPNSVGSRSKGKGDQVRELIQVQPE
jgi:hypothetical protein